MTLQSKLSYVHNNTLNNNRQWANPQNIGTAYTNYWYTTNSVTKLGSFDVHVRMMNFVKVYVS